MTTPQFLQNQYRDARNLEARIRLHRQFSTNPYGWYRWYLDRLDLSPQARILELGCGPAALWTDNTGRLPPGAVAVLTDFSPGMVRQARRDIPDGRFHFAVTDAQAIPFPAESFDVVLANHMLYHVPNRDRAIAEIRRVLRPGGRLYAATNGSRHMIQMDEIVLRLAPQFSIPPGLAAAFTLENGGEQIARHFQQVRLERYPDELIVTEAGPFVDYVLSMSANASRTIEPREVERFTRAVEAEIQNGGPLRILKDAGVFIAS